MDSKKAKKITKQVAYGASWDVFDASEATGYLAALVGKEVTALTDVLDKIANKECSNLEIAVQLARRTLIEYFKDISLIERK